MSKIYLDKDDVIQSVVVQDLVNLALGYESWEADLVLNNDWDGEDGMPTLTHYQYEKLMELQERRNKVLSKFRGEN